jgi:beta-N-acetylhexosaminidase
MASVRVEAVGAATSLADRKTRAGQRLILGVHGHAVDSDLRALVAAIQPAGFLLFGRNVAEPAQVLDLTEELRSLVDPHRPPLLFIDQEGGRVQRIRAPATEWPAADELAASGRVREVACALGTELRAMGLDVDLAPVADVRRSGAHEVIGDRAFGSSETAVADAVAAFVRGLLDAHVQPVAKHWPGHGAATVDSHEALPVVELDRPELEAVDARPFLAAVAAGARAMLTAHVLYPALDEEWPASLSARHTARLRPTFPGVLITDDLEMGAVAGAHPPERLARRVACAGLDLAIVGHTAATQMALYEAFVRDQEDDPGLDTLATDSARRVEAFREHTLLGRPPRPSLDLVGCAAHRQLRDDVLQRVRGRV